MNSKGRFAIGAVVGAVAGVIAGLLTAPKPGKESRADLKKKARDLKEGAAGKVSDLREDGREAAKKMKDELNKG